MDKYTSCEISDALLKLGVKSGGYIPDLQCFSTPSTPPLFGPIFPVTMVPFSDSTSPRPSQHFVDASPAGSIILISAPVGAKNSCWGGLMTLGAKGRGVKGVVVLGRVRDLEEHRRESFPVFAYSHSTLPQAPFTRPSFLNEPITIPLPHLPLSSSSPSEQVPTLIINPGDFLLADLDGVVAVPKELVEKVISGAEQRREIDALCEEDLRKGRGVAETFKDRRK